MRTHILIKDLQRLLTKYLPSVGYQRLAYNGQISSNNGRLSRSGRIPGTVWLLMMAIGLSSSAWGQTVHSNPWAPTEVGPLPPIASLTDGVWLKGDLHLHSRHSNDASNNPIAKIIAFSRGVGMDYL